MYYVTRSNSQNAIWEDAYQVITQDPEDCLTLIHRSYIYNVNMAIESAKVLHRQIDSIMITTDGLKPSTLTDSAPGQRLAVTDDFESPVTGEGLSEVRATSNGPQLKPVTGIRIINHSSNNWNNMNITRQNSWVKEDLLAMDLSSLCVTGGKPTHVDAGGDDLGTEETKKRRSTYVDGGGGSGVKKGEGGGDRQPWRRGSSRSPGVPDPVVPNHLETGSGAHHLEAITGDHHRSSGTKKRSPELRDEEDPSEISRIRQGWEGRRGGAGAADGGRGGGRGPTTAAVSTARGSAAIDTSSRASASVHASQPPTPPTMEPAMEAASLGPNTVRPSAGARGE
uniref:Uncharacterized protein n=1 Tax=Oryza glumipatula TaxID=40148 RepID=A0A0E0AAN5_9ORYZ